MSAANQYIVAIDQGTTSTRALVVNTRGEIIGTSQESGASNKLPALYPQPGWVELDPARLWATVRDAVQAAVDHAGVTIDQVAALGLANQGETVIAFDADTGAPFGNAISWQDRRADPVVACWREDGLEADVHAITGLRLDSYFSAAKLRWILGHSDQAAAARDRGRLRLGTSDAWLLWQLTGGRSFITDAATASRTMLLDLDTGAWSPSLCHVLGIDERSLPAIVANAGDLAVTDPALFGRAIPITGLCVDQHAALFGHGCRAEGQAKATYGTGCFVLANAGDDPGVREPGLLTALAWRIGETPCYTLEGGVYSAGSMVEWLTRLGLIHDPADIDTALTSVADSRGVVMIPALSGLAAPYWQSRARAVWAGMDSGTEPGHLVRAALESIAYRVRDIRDAMHSAGVDIGVGHEGLRADGGLTRSRALMQLQADVLGCPVDIKRSPEVTALGVALMAGLGAGLWSEDALPDAAATAARIEPGDTQRAGAAYCRWRRVCEAVARGALDSISAGLTSPGSETP